MSDHGKQPFVRPAEPDPVMQPTPRETKLAELAEENKAVGPVFYNITSPDTAKALRVVHNFYGRAVAIAPGKTKEMVPLHPNLAEYLKKGDLRLARCP